MDDESAELATLAEKLRLPASTESIPLGRMAETLQDMGASPELSAQFVENARPALALVEALTNEQPDDQAVRDILVYEITEEATLAIIEDQALQNLAHANQDDWVADNRLVLVINRQTGHKEWIRETDDARDTRLQIQRGAKKDWDDRVARTRHQNPRLVAASLFLARQPSNLVTPATRDSLANDLVRVMTQLDQGDAPTQSIPESQRDQALWEGLAKIALSRVQERPDRQESVRQLAFNEAIRMLGEQMARAPQETQGLYQTITNSYSFLGSVAKRLDQPALISNAEVARVLVDLGINRVRIAEQRYNGVLITSGLEIDGRIFHPRQSPETRLYLLRALLGKPPIEESKVEAILGLSPHQDPGGVGN